MTDPRVRGLPARAAPPPPRGVMRWIASEWGLAVLALILAFLVWAVVWGRITEEDTISVEVVPQTSGLFVAYPEGPVVLRLDGPRGELEDARALLGSRVTVAVKDLDPGVDAGDYHLTTPDQFTFPFPRRLVAGIESGTTLHVFRWERTPVHFQRPKIENLPDGIGYTISLVPDTAMLRVPATTVDATIEPDPIDVQEDLAVLPENLELKPKVVSLTFNAWAGDSTFGAYRDDVVLPDVTATLRFHLVNPRKIRNRVDFRFPESADPEHFEVAPSGNEEVIVLGRFEGTFVGREKDLAKLEAEKDAWHYLVRIPANKLPTEAGANETVRLEIEFMRVAGLTEHPVKLEKVQATVVVTRKAPE